MMNTVKLSKKLTIAQGVNCGLDIEPEVAFRQVEINKTNMKIRKFQLAVLAGLAGATLSVQAGLTTVATTGSWDGNPPGTLATVMQTLLNDPSYDVNAAANRVQDSGPINDQT